MEQEIMNKKQELEAWLSDPHELGSKPFEIKYVTQFEDEDGIHCTIFKFQKHFLGKWYLGIVSDSGTFSEMKEFDMMTATEDAKELLEMLKNYWKERAKEFSEQES